MLHPSLNQRLQNGSVDTWKLVLVEIQEPFLLEGCTEPFHVTVLQP